MKRNSLTALALLVCISATTGCVSDSEYRKLEMAYRNTLEQVAERDARIAELEAQIAALRSGPEQQAAMLAALQDENDRLRKQLDDLRGEIEKLGARGNEIVILNPETDAALKEFAAQHPDLVEYDAARGMVKFRSDLTFALGSDTVTANARNTLGQLAGILNSAAGKYEIRIIGHTDSVRISRAETRAKHPTNWHLSSHRAISVKDALEASGVNPVRMMVGGYSMYRPIAPNSRSGSEPNRRVEIYLVSMTPVNESYLGGGEVSGGGGGDGGATRTGSITVSPTRSGESTGSVDDRIPLK